jgi:hypothetical protein
MALIIVRNIYRLVELGTDMNSPILGHEWFSYVWDAAPMFLALVALNVVSPGAILQGPKSDFSAEDRERKMAKQAEKAADSA